MYNEVERIGLEQVVKGIAIADVDIGMLELLGGSLQAIEVPGGVALRAEENLSHVVVDADNAMPLAIEMLDRLRADEPAASRDQYGFHIAPMSPRVRPASLPDFADFFADHGVSPLAAKCFRK